MTAPPPQPPPPRVLLISIYSHLGLVRENNEDAVGIDGFAIQGDHARPLDLAVHLDRPRALAVCDGMGGHAGGAEASSLAAQRTTTIDPLGGVLTPEAVQPLLQRTSDELNEVSESIPELRGLGTTIAAAYLRTDGSVLIANVGDARAYQLEGGYLAQLTVDHRNPDTGNLSQALGAGQRVVLAPDFYECTLDETGLVLCSDGIWEFVDDDAIGAEIANRTSPITLAGRLIDRALASGGGDNATVVHLRLQPLPQPHQA